MLIPRDWLLRTLGQSRFRGQRCLGTLFSLPGMMCTCCAAPVAAGMRRQQVSMGGALAFWMGNPVLNPATLVFMGFVLGWGFAAIRLVAGLVMVLLIATLVQKWVRETPQTQAPVEIDIPEAQGGFFSRWGRALWTLFWSTIPVYILAVLVLGAARVWLFPHADGAVDNSLMWVMAMAVAGCLFVVHGSRNSDCTNDDAGRYGNCSGAGIVDDAPGGEFAVTDYAAQSVPGESLMADRGDGGSVWCDCRRAGAVVLI